MTAVYTNLRLALSEKLGWGDMLASIAIPALDRIINNYKTIIFDLYDVTEEDIDEASLQYDMLRIPADFLFGHLYISGIDDCMDNESCDMFRSLRWEIEREMRRGASYQEAIDEWFK